MARVTKWDAVKVIAATQKEAAKRMGLATIFVRDEVKRLINRGNADGSDPSLEGEPPKKVSARLFGAIRNEVVTEGTTITGYVGTNVEYARRLELGFHGSDSLGRVVDQGPRPFFRPGLLENIERVRRILGASK